MIARHSCAVLVLATALAAGCSPTIEEGRFACDATRGCPDGWFCRDSRCYQSRGPGIDAAVPTDATVDAEGTDALVPPDTSCVEPVEGIDILLMVDDSGSMVTAQALLVQELPRLIEGLVRGDADGDGTRDFLPIDDLQVGVLTPNLGIGSSTLPMCSVRGDDGSLLTESRGTDATCAETYPAILAHTGMTSAFVADVACLAETGSMGCGFEQHFEAMLKALTPSTSSLRFFLDTMGKGDTANAGFLRDDAALLLIVIADEPDCSTTDADLFNLESTVFTSDPSVRCIAHESALQPIDRYVSGFGELKPGHPERLVLAQLTGVPTDLSGEDLATIDADPRMEPTIVDRPDPEFDEITPVCDTASARAQPTRRNVELAMAMQQAGHEAFVYSICDASYVAFTQELLATVQRLQLGTCP